MDELGIFLVLFAAGIGALVAWASAGFRAAERRTLEARGERIAQRLGGSFHPGSFARPPSVRFRAHGRPALMGWSGDDRESSTVVTVDMRGRSPGLLQICPVGRELGRGPLQAAPLFRTGRREFDSRFRVRSVPASLAGHVFSPERRARAIAAASRLYGPARIDLRRDQLALTVPVRLEVEAELLLLARSADEFAEFLLEPVPCSGIEWLDVPLPAGGHCPVCGSPLAEDVVYCRRCRTPHHRECWGYIGECSTYACREPSFARGLR